MSTRAAGRTVWFVAAIAAVFLAIGVGLTIRLGHSATWSGGDLTLLPWLLPLGAGSYLLRFVRWHVLVRQLASRLPLGRSLRIYLAGFAMGLTPGRLGEFCKFALLRSATGVPELQSAPIFPLERATEAASFAALAVAGASIGHFQPASLGASALAMILALPLLALLALALRFLSRRSAASTAGSSWRQLLAGVQSVAGPRPLALALACALTARCFDAALFWTAVRAAGVQLPLPAAALAFGLAGLTGGFSLLPAGVGAVEASLVATVAALGAPAGPALLAALLARCVTLWLWIPPGLWFAFRDSSARPISVVLEPVAVTVPVQTPDMLRAG